MKVLYVSNDNLISKLTLNKTYAVFECEFILNNKEKQYISFKIQDDMGNIFSYASKYFEIASNEITNYIGKKIGQYNYKLTHHIIAYENFWTLLGEKHNIALEDFLKSKKDIYIMEMSRAELRKKINEDNLDERNFILNLSIAEKNSFFIDDVIKICKKEFSCDFDNKNIELLFLYLSKFMRDNISQLFIEYLAESKWQNEKLNKIVYGYFCKYEFVY